MAEQREPFDQAAYDWRTRAGPCFICALLAGDPAYRHHVVYQDAVAVVFLDKYPVQYGHLLVAPVAHREHVTGDFSPDEYLALQRVVHRAGEALRRVVPTERLYMLSLGSQQGNRHVHWHLVPLPPGVPYEQQQLRALRAERGVVRLTESEGAALAAALRRALVDKAATLIGSPAHEPTGDRRADGQDDAANTDAQGVGVLVVRPAQPGDWPGLWPLLQGMGQVTAEAAARERFGRVVLNPAECLPVAELDGSLVGYAWAHQGPTHLRAGTSTVRLNDLYVAPERRRRGIGRRLLAAVIAWATERQADWLEWQASQAALPFYARLGYRGDPCPDPQHPYFELALTAGQRRG